MWCYGINIHIISASENYAKGQLLIEALELLQVDVWGIQEVNLNTGCPHIQHDIKSLFKKMIKGSKYRHPRHLKYSQININLVVRSQELPVN